MRSRESPYDRKQLVELITTTSPYDRHLWCIRKNRGVNCQFESSWSGSSSSRSHLENQLHINFYLLLNITQRHLRKQYPDKNTEYRHGQKFLLFQEVVMESALKIIWVLYSHFNYYFFGIFILISLEVNSQIGSVIVAKFSE